MGEPDANELRLWETTQKCMDLMFPLTPDDRARILRTLRVFFDAEEVK